MKEKGSDRKTDFLKGCAGKIQHKTWLSAEYFFQNRNTCVHSEIYLCDICGYFHIGTSNDKPKIEIKTKIKEDNEQHKRKHKRFKY